MRIVQILSRFSFPIVFYVLAFGGLITEPALATARRVQREASLPANFHLLPGPQAVVTMPVELLDGDPNAVRLRFSEPPLEVNTITHGGTDYTSIRLSGEGSTVDAGIPDLPRVSRLVMVSNTGQIVGSAENLSFHTEVLDYLPQPVQLLEGEDGNTAFATPDAAVYGVDAWYPPNVVEVSAPATLRDVRFVVVTVYPVQVNPVTREMRVYDVIDVAVDNVGGSGPNEIVTTPTSITPGFHKLYRAFENFEGSALDELPEVPGKQLIICDGDAAVVQEVQRLITWRRKKGIDAYYTTLATIGGNDATLIHNYINAQYTSSNGALEFVTIVGDPDASPPYDVSTHNTQLDNYYGTMGSGPNPDPVPDIAVGRLPVTSSNDLISIVSKTINYEADPYIADTTWFTRAWCAAHTNFVASNPSTKEYTRQIMLQGGMNPVNFDIFSGGMVTSTLETRINQGVCVFNDRMSWVGEFGTNQVDGLNNGRKLPFVMVVTCGTGTFNGSYTLSEAWLKPAGQTNANPKGAIGAVGLSGLGTHVPYNNIIDAGVMWGFFVQDIYEQGIAVVAGKLQLYRNYADVGHLGDVQNFSYWANLMGDPAVPVWMHVPHATTVTRPATLSRGTNNVTVSVAQGGNPVEGALVGLIKGTETFARGYTDATGSINLPVSLPTTGYLNVTVTGPTIDSYVDSIQVQAAAQSLAYFSLTVDDDNTGGTVGDGNGVLNPGETVDLTLRLQNAGTSTTVTGISGTLSASLPGIQIVSGTQTYPNIAVGANAAPSAPFRIQVGQVFNGEPIAFFLNTTSSAGDQDIRADLTPVAGDVNFVSSAFIDANSRLDPGDAGSLTVTFLNSGARTLTGISAVLRSFDSHVTVTDSVGTYANVNAGTNGTNTTNPFGVSASIQTVGGYQARMQLVIVDANGFRDSTTFNQTVGVAVPTTPTGPDAYGYYAYDNTETQPAGSASEYLWVEIAPALGGAGTSLNFNDNTEDADVSAVRTLPFGFVFYGQTFNEITICSNGWLAFGNQTNIDFRNYRIGTAIGPCHMVAAYWDDLITTGTNNGVWIYNDAATSRYIVEWRTQGLWSGAAEVFQVILHDPDVYTSPTGDGKILVQYQTVNMVPNPGSNDNDYATIGIQNGDHSIGLEYSYWNTYPPTAATLTTGRAIMYTTDNLGTVPTALTLVTPNGGEIWYQHRQQSVAWFGGNDADNIHIELSRNGVGGPWETVVTSTANDGDYSFIVSGPVSTNCRIRLTSIENPVDTDLSAGNFTISPLQVISPNGGDIWYHDSTATITWAGGDAAMNVRIELSRSGASGPWQTVEAATANDGVHSFVVSGATSATCRVRITSLGDATDTDISDADFRIAAIQAVLFEDFEDGAAEWTHTSAGGQWQDNWHIDSRRAFDGTSAYHCSLPDTTYANLCDSWLLSPVLAELPANATLNFYMQIYSEISSAYPDSAYDAGLLEISADGGPWTPVTPEGGGYNKHTRCTAGGGNPYTGPFACATPCWAGSVSAWSAVTLDLAAYAGQDIQFRFRFGSDAGGRNEGWYVDHLTVFAPAEIIPEPTVPTAVTLRVVGNDVLLRWADDGNTYYRVYSSLNASGPYSLFEGSTDQNSLTIANSATALRKFYLVVGSDTP